MTNPTSAIPKPLTALICAIALSAIGVATLSANAVAADANLVINPGFEGTPSATSPSDAPSDPLTNWATFGTPWRANVGDDAYSGKFGAVNDVAPDADAEYSGIHQEIAIDPAKHYEASVMIRLVNVSTTQTYLEVQFLGSDDSVLSQVDSPPLAADQAFTKVSLANLIPPAGAAKASVRAIVHILSKPDHTNFQVFDDFTFTQSAESGH